MKNPFSVPYTRVQLSFFAIILLAVVCGQIFCLATPARGTELSVPTLDVSAGKPFDIPLMVDKVEKLAGVKIVLHYDKTYLSFAKAAKTKKTSSLMHVVNDKTPGRLILVMAGPKGISGEKFALLMLTFKVRRPVKQKKRVEFKIDRVEMMNEKLKNIPCKIDPGSITLQP